MKTILIPIDFSDVTEPLMQQGEALCRAFGAEAFLLHVVEPYQDVIAAYPEAAPLWTEHSDDQDKQRVLDGEDRIAVLQKRLTDAGIAVRTHVVYGLPGDEVVRQAEILPADMVLIGSHGHGALYHLLMGGVCEHALHHAPCPVMVVSSRLNKKEE